MTKRLTTEEFIQRAIAAVGDVYDYSLVDYKNSKTKVKVRCKKHGRVEEVFPYIHLRTGNGCPLCKNELNTPTMIKCRDDHRETSLAYVRKNQQERLFRSSKLGSIARNIEHTITIDDVMIPEFCPLLGVKLTNISGRGRQITNASIDRIDNSKGYIPGNVQIISDLANQMKSSATPNQLITFAENILRIYKGEDTEETLSLH